MASIIKRKKNYSIVYNYTDENGETRQKWETRTSYQDALKRKAEVENQQFTGTFLLRAVLVLERGLPCHKHGTVRRRSPRNEEPIR